MKKGFTLIELLVVVLIIGILSAIALPQYTKAVTKTRYAALKPLTQSIANAQQVYYLSNGRYATSFAELDVDIGEEQPDDETHRYFPWGHCAMSTAYNNVFCKNLDINMAYLIFLETGQRVCIIYANNSVLHEICKQETNGAEPDGSESIASYIYP